MVYLLRSLITILIPLILLSSVKAKSSSNIKIDQLQLEFDQKLKNWHSAIDKLHKDNPDFFVGGMGYEYTMLPEFFKISKLSKKHLSYFYKELSKYKKEWKGINYHLAFNVIDICKWDKNEFFPKKKIKLNPKIIQDVLKKMEERGINSIPY